MLARTLIERKRDGGRITPSEWRQLMSTYGAGEVPDYQMSALAMAIYFNGLDRQELGAFTDARALLEPLARAYPRAAKTQYELGRVLAALGDDECE